MVEKRLPTSEDVMKKIKDDGDFDALRLKIIRSVKENEELRTSIIEQVKQSDVLNQDSSESMKPRQLSDAIYQELGRKITAQISDELWKVIRSNGSIRDDIRATVELVFSKMIGTPPIKNQTVLKEGKGDGTNTITTSIATPTREANKLSSNEINGDDHSEKSRNSGLEDSEQPPDFPRLSPESFAQSGGGGGEVDDDSDLPPGFS